MHALRLRQHLAAGGELAPQPAIHPLPAGEVQYYATDFQLLEALGTKESSCRRLRPKGAPLGQLIGAPSWVPVDLVPRSVAKRFGKPGYGWQEVSRGTLILTNRRMLQLLWAANGTRRATRNHRTGTVVGRDPPCRRCA